MLWLGFFVRIANICKVLLLHLGHARQLSEGVYKKASQPELCFEFIRTGRRVFFLFVSDNY